MSKLKLALNIPELPDDFNDFWKYLNREGKADEVLDSPSTVALIIKEYKKWKRGEPTR